MIRDSKMMQLVACDKEPITPFVRVITALKEQGISTILVVGGTGDYFDVADHVLLMDSYCCVDATTRAREIAQQNQPNSEAPAPAPFLPIRKRYPQTKKMRFVGKAKVLARNIISYNDSEIDLSMTEQIVSKFQANAIASALQHLGGTGNSRCMDELLDRLEQSITDGGLDVIAPGKLDGTFIRPRKFEIGAAMNRLRRDFIKQI
jgi:predicted ABC-class ATPase